MIMDVDMIYTKVVSLNVIYKFLVDNVFIYKFVADICFHLRLFQGPNIYFKFLIMKFKF
jgi:hypothetical protein